MHLVTNGKAIGMRCTRMTDLVVHTQASKPKPVTIDLETPPLCRRAVNYSIAPPC